MTTSDECPDCEVAVDLADPWNVSYLCSSACGSHTQVIPAGPAQAVELLRVSEPLDHAPALLRGRHSVWVMDDDGGPGYRLDSGCPWHPHTERFTHWDGDGLHCPPPTAERYQHEGGGLHALYIIRTYDDPDATDEPATPILKDLLDPAFQEPTFCGCCGNLMRLDEVNSAAVRGEWCTRCASHVDASGQHAPWLQTYEALNGKPCPFQV